MEALLALHYQNDVLHPDGRIQTRLGNDVERIALLGAARELLALARRRGWIIVHVRIAFSLSHVDLTRKGATPQQSEVTGAARDGDWGAQFYESLGPMNGPREFVTTHASVSAFQGTQLEQILREHEVNRIMVAGAATHLGVQSTVSDAADLGYEVEVVLDACAAVREGADKTALASLAQMAKLTTLHDLNSLGRSGSDMK